MKCRALFTLAATVLLFTGASHATTPSLADPFHDSDAIHDAWAELEAGDLFPASEQMPWDYPEQLLNPLANDPVALDPSFSVDGWIRDGFGTTYPLPYPGRSTEKSGRRVIRTSDGGAIVAALVPALGSTTSPTTFNLGLVRYDASGSRVKWTLASAQYTDTNKNWFVYPNMADGKFTAIHDLQEFGGYLYIAVTRRYSASDIDAHVIKVSLNGDWANVFFPLNSGTFNEAGAGLVFERGTLEDRMLFVGRRIDADGKYSTILKRFIVPTGNILPTLDTGFGTGGEKSMRFNACGTGGTQPCATAAQRVAYAPGNPILNSQTVVYVAGNVHVGSEIHSFVYKLDMNGNLDTGWGINGGGRAYLDVGGRRVNTLYGLTLGDAVCTSSGPPLHVLSCKHELFLTVAAEGPNLNCGLDIATAKIKTDGYFQLNFGNNGWVGGPPANPSACYMFGSYSATPAAALLDGNRLVVVGSSSWRSAIIGSPTVYSGELKIYDANSGALRFADSYQVGNQDTYFNWVEKAGADRFYVAGTVTDPTYVTTWRFRIAPAIDRIFSDGMESP